jgi:hypothetical protein
MGNLFVALALCHAEGHVETAASATVTALLTTLPP